MEETSAPTEIQEQPEVTVEPTKDVETFWSKLDRVLELNLESAQMRDRVESLLEEFPDNDKLRKSEASFVFQPERVTLSSNDDVGPQEPIASVQQILSRSSATSFSSFILRLKKMLRNVKSIQLISSSIPSATTQIPDDEIIFLYYRIQSLENSGGALYAPATIYAKGTIVYTGAPANHWYVSKQANNQGNAVTDSNWWVDCGTDGTRPNYFQLRPANIKYVSLTPSYAFPEFFNPPQYATFNRTFGTFNDLLATFQACAATVGNAAIPDDIEMLFIDELNKFQFAPQNVASYFYMPLGYNDPNLSTFITQILPFTNCPVRNLTTPLNVRMGFSWNGQYPDPYSLNPYSATSEFIYEVYPYLRPEDPGAVAVGLPAFVENVVTANSYADLVYTSTCRIFADFVLGSTEDSKSQGGLLATVPINSNNLGIAFYQSAYQNPVTKIPENLTEIAIRLVTDSGAPYVLPNSAVVNLELAVTYK